jgi:hypothetical protein
MDHFRDVFCSASSKVTSVGIEQSRSRDGVSQLGSPMLVLIFIFSVMLVGTLALLVSRRRSKIRRCRSSSQSPPWQFGGCCSIHHRRARQIGHHNRGSIGDRPNRGQWPALHSILTTLDEPRGPSRMTAFIDRHPIAASTDDLAVRERPAQAARETSCKLRRPGADRFRAVRRSFRTLCQSIAPVHRRAFFVRARGQHRVQLSRDAVELV